MQSRTEVELSTETSSEALEIETAESTSAPETETETETATAAEATTEAETETETGAGPETTAPAAEAESAPAAQGNGAASKGPGSLPNWWTDAYPQVTNVSSAVAYLDAIGGAISRSEKDGRWVLSTGKQVLFEASTSEELDGFLLGFALSQLISERHGPISQARRG